MPHPTPTTLTTPRLRLRWLSEADVPALFAIFSHPEVMRYWSTPPFTDIAQAHELLAQILDDYRTATALPLGIERTADAQLVGTCTLFAFHEASRRAELGYSLGRPFWGVGYMHEALQALLDYAFQMRDLNRLEADIDPRNRASARTLERLGFRQEGFLRERWIVSGEVSDSALYGLLRREWQARERA
jgi:[ribosomal protein S5]-alanine N-acetyltransferase